MLAAGAVAPVVTVDHFGGINWVVCDPDLARAALLDGRLSEEAGYAGLFERAGLEHRGSTATESLHPVRGCRTLTTRGARSA